MGEIVKFNQVEEKIITVRKQKVILDSDVAELYDVDTNDVNQAVKRNPDKFPDGYIIGLTASEKAEVATNCGNPKIKFSPALPNAFTKKGLYMLATILKGEKATQTTIDIIEAFEKIQDMSMSIAELMKDHGNEQKQKNATQKSEELFGEIIGKAMETVGTETSFELNLAALKIKHTIKREVK